MSDSITAKVSGDALPKPPAERPLAIQVEGLKKTFRIPSQRVDSLKERAVRPFAKREYKELRALDDVSFEVHQGEFFGIVGRNGSGKSTLLKLLASIYRADAGRIQIAGRLAPFIELGVGFNHELTARENVVLNGVMMGLTPSQAKGSLEAVLQFAELEEYVDLKLKNYSSGMLVRLAFSVMLQANADVLLIDEILAVGDASFQQKCADAFRRMKAEGKTIILVTHEMATVEAYCHRAMLISDGDIQAIGDPREVASQYLRLNFERGVESGGGETAKSSGEGVELLDIWLEDDAGQRTTSIEGGAPIRLHLNIKVLKETSGISIGFVIANAEGLGMFQFGVPVRTADGHDLLRAGQGVQVEAKLENPLAVGRYFIHCGVQHRGTVGENVSLYTQNALDFLVFGDQAARGVLAIPHTIEATVDGDQSA